MASDNISPSVGRQGPSQIFAPRKVPPQNPAPLEQYGHEGMRGYLMRIAKPRVGRSFSSQVMSGARRGVQE